MIELQKVGDLVPVPNFLNICKAEDYIITLNSKDIGILEAHITTHEIYIFNVELNRKFQKRRLFKTWLESLDKRIIVFWPKPAVRDYWSTVADSLIY